ncbi:hypothetical protein ISN45_Aa03g010870, partial [Arabidopsis thaliana x Arabidopsis arenosa]
KKLQRTNETLSLELWKHSGSELRRAITHGTNANGVSRTIGLLSKDVWVMVSTI